jgi:hypothetical protein
MAQGSGKAVWYRLQRRGYISLATKTFSSLRETEKESGRGKQLFDDGANGIMNIVSQVSEMSGDLLTKLLR